MSGQRILVVDDEPQIHRFLKPALTALDFDVLSATTLREARRLVLSRAPDLVVLDLGLPDGDGKDLIADLRAFVEVPIIVLSARDSEGEKVEALDRGADDYIEKPFGIPELAARVRAALRRSAQVRQPDDVFEHGGLSVSPATRTVLSHGRPVHLTPKEYDLLLELVRHTGRVLTHRHLLNSVWGPAHGEDVQYLRVVIGQLRAKIETDPSHPRLILNEPAVGYRLSIT